MASQPETPEPSRAARDRLNEIVDQLDLRRRRAAESLDRETMRRYRTRLRGYLDWCLRQGLQPEITDASARDYVDHLTRTDEFRPGTLGVLLSGLRFYAAALDPVPSLVEAHNLALLYRKAYQADGAPIQRRGPRRKKPRWKAS